MNRKRARRFLSRNKWNLSPTKLDTLPDWKKRNLLKEKARAEKVLMAE